MALDKDLTADAEKHSNALAWKTTHSSEDAPLNVSTATSISQTLNSAVKTSVIQQANEPQGTKVEDAVGASRARLMHDMDPSGQFRVPVYKRRGSPDGEHADSCGAARVSRASLRSAGLQRRDLETPPGLLSRTASSQVLAGVASPTFSDVSLLRMTPGNDERARVGSRDSCRWPHYRVMPPIWGATPDAHESNVAREYEPPPLVGSFADTEFFPSHFASPRQSAHVRRKRPISISPFSLDVDINQLIRTSPSSLVAYINGSRASSVNSGSYGHLAAGKSSPSFNFPGAPPHLVRREAAPTFEPTESSAPSPPALGHAEEEKSESEENVDANGKEEEMNVESKDEETDVKREPEVDGGAAGGAAKEDECVEEESKPEEVDANCHWKECKETFESRHELVQHVNNEHIHCEKRDFTCHWRGCCRLQKPFKAQYMLVVHMRRHTGEKPHKCTFDGCSKAYSRLENLKTHLRSHTGEKPYMCEFPGCTKAFTNASDRAKHQNRTHSNLKPYVCKNAGCPKRYTDPSSLRKHMKSCQLGVKKARGEDCKDTSTGIQTFPPTSQQSVKPAVTLESKNISNECVNILKMQQVDQSGYGNHQMSRHSPDKTELGYGMYADRRYSNVSQLSSGSIFIDETSAGSRRGSNFSQASNCSYVNQGNLAMMATDPNVLAGRRGSGDVSPAGLPLNTSPNAFLASQQQQQQMFNRSSPRMGQHHVRSLAQEASGCRRESGVSLGEYVSSPPSNQPSSRRSSLNSTFSYPPAPDSGIGCFDYGSRRSSNSSVTSNQVPSQPYFMSMNAQIQPQSPSPYGMHRSPRPLSGRLLPLHGESKFIADETQLTMHQRRASDSNAPYTVYRPSDCHTNRRASDPLHHLPHTHMKGSSRGYLRNQLTPTRPLPFPPAMQFQQQHVNGYVHTSSPLPMAVDDSQSTFTAMMQTTKLHHAMPSPSYSQGYPNTQMGVQQHRDVGMEDVSIDLSQFQHPPVHAGHTGVMPQCNGFTQQTVSNFGMTGLMSNRSALLDDHQRWIHSATDEPLSVYT